MAKGTWEDIAPNSKGQKWGICKNKFKSTSKAHITNECLHIFHSDWLENWYFMTKPGADLVCPICRTVNWSKSQQPRALTYQFGNLSLDENSSVFQKNELDVIKSKFKSQNNEKQIDFQSNT